MKIKLYRSATVGLDLQGYKILMDPWLTDGEYYGSWSHFPYFDFDKNLDEIENNEVQCFSKLEKRRIEKLKTDELNNTYWEVETGEFLKSQDLKEIEEERDTLIKFLISKDDANETISTLCKNYEKLCKEKYPEAPLPLEILNN
jgi:hypothetical protein